MIRQSLISLLAFCLFASCTTTITPPPEPLPAAPVPVSVSNRLSPLATSPRLVQPPLVRVGLQSDQSRVEFARVQGGYVLIADAGPSRIGRGFTVTAPLAEATIRYAVQVAAISDRVSSTALQEKIRAESGERVDLLFDAAGGVYRVIAGDFPDEAAAIPLRDRLTLAGYGRDMMIVRRPSDQPFQKVLQLIDDEGERHSMTTESLLVLPAVADPVLIGEKPYRGGARLFINTRGLMNVINELNLEDYVRGVIPGELGPRVYDELEAQKAQALAARTYVARRLGEFAPEGYDICATPACQVYGGMGTEEALSDQAVRETAGLVIVYDGQPIDALFTSTCGGYTSDVATMFPGRTDPYLKRARCIELDTVPLEGSADSGILSEMQASSRLFIRLAGISEPGSWTAKAVVTAVSAAAGLAGYPLPAATPPASARRGEVLRYLGEVWGLVGMGKTLLFPEDRAYLFPRSPAEEDPYVAAAFLIKYGIVPAQHVDRIDLQAAMPREELYALLYSWLREMDAAREISGRVASISGRQIGIKVESKVSSYDLPAGIPLFRSIRERLQEYSSVPVLVGDRVTLVQAHGAPAALILNANYDGASFDRTSSFANWTRSWRADELVPVIARRNPIQTLTDIRPLGVDASQRVIELEVTAEGGRKFVLRGLPIRWSLNVPDNLFIHTKTRDADGMDRYTFFGKGWGHGTGMCQVGAFGMATRGWTAEQIIKRYYSGVEILPFSSVAR